MTGESDQWEVIGVVDGGWTSLALNVAVLYKYIHTSTGVSVGVSARKKFKLEFEIRYTKMDFKCEKYES